jgi:ribosomal protein S27AE
MGQTAQYCGECHALFSVLPVDKQSEKEKDFLKAGKFHVDYKKTIRTDTGTCEKCGQIKVVWFYPL